MTIDGIDGSVRVNDRITVRVVSAWCTPDGARELLRLNTFGRQRTFRVAYAEFLANEMRLGRFLPGEVVRFVRGERGADVMVDGQHRLEGIVKAGKPQLILIMYYEGLTEQEMAEYYSRIDVGEIRKRPDRIKALGLKDQIDLTETNTRLVSRAMAVILAGMTGRGGGRQSAEDIAAKALDYSDGIHEWLECTTGAPEEMHRPLQRAVTVAAGIVTFQDGPSHVGAEMVTDFWTGVIFDDGLRTGDPRKTLHKDMVAVTERHAGGGGLISGTEMLWRIAKCWNAWLAGEHVAVLGRDTRGERGSMVLKNTRFDGKAATAE